MQPECLELTKKVLHYFAMTVKDTRQMAQACEAIRHLNEDPDTVKHFTHTRKEPPTDKQMAFLRSLNYKGNLPRTKIEAMDLITRLKRK